MMRIVLLGAPGSGKGTQAQRLQAKYGVPQVSSGDLLRDAVARGTELGRKAKAVMDAGQLVSDDIVLGLIRERLSRPDAANGFILDGFPRNIEQANSLNALLEELGQPIDAVLLLDVRNETLMQRLAGRRICPKCGTVYNVHSMPAGANDLLEATAPSCIQRPDDKEEVIGKRLEVYETADAAADRALLEARPAARRGRRGRARRSVRAHGSRSAGEAGAGRESEGQRRARRAAAAAKTAQPPRRQRRAKQARATKKTRPTKQSEARRKRESEVAPKASAQGGRRSEGGEAQAARSATCSEAQEAARQAQTAPGYRVLSLTRSASCEQRLADHLASPAAQQMLRCAGEHQLLDVASRGEQLRR